MRTLKIKCYVDDEDKKIKSDNNKRFKEIYNSVWRAANCVVNGQFANDLLMSTLYDRIKYDLNEKYKLKNLYRTLYRLKKEENNIEIKKLEKEIKNNEKHRDVEFKKLAAIEEKKFKDYFGVLRQAITEHDVQVNFPELPSCVTNPLTQLIYKNYKKNKPTVSSGETSISSYKKNFPICVNCNSITFYKNDKNEDCFVWSLSKKEKIIFKIAYGKDNGNYRSTINKIIVDQLKFSTPSFIYKKDHEGKEKLFLNLPVEDDKKEILLNKDICLGVDLGINVPAFIAVNNSKASLALGTKDEFFRVRTCINRKIRNIQKNLVFVKGGKGRNKKLKALNKYKGEERKFVNSYNHKISKRVVDFALLHNAGTIKLELLDGYGENIKHRFILRNWSYAELQTMIEYKAKNIGIDVCYVDPYHTSQICSKCGHYEEGQRDKLSFKCKSCGYEEHADYNAAKNISISIQYVNKKEDCEYYKLKKKKFNNNLFQLK
jgi:IS605 OrfB family transposase